MSTHPSPGRIERAMSAAQQALAMLGSTDDEQLIRDTIEGESDAFAVIDRLAEIAIADKLLAEIAAERAKRISARADRARDLIQRMMEELGLERMERAVYTASLRLSAGSVVIEDTGEVPQYYLKSAPDRDAIRKAMNAGQPVPGCTLVRKPTLTILTR